MANLTDIQTISEYLGAISGSEHLIRDEGAICIAPANTEQVATSLRFANENGITVTAWGGGTKQGWGNPCQPTLILKTQRLAAVREHTWQDMTCTVEAGCTWSSMQASLSRHGQFVALDPLWPDRATIGGVIATNDSGSLRLRYGSLRDLVIGMTIVLADGTVARSGGKVVKNVAGYDLHKLMTGAFGTLGIITEITFRLHSIPRHAPSFTIASPNVEALAQMLLKVLDSHLSTQSLQLRSGTAGFYLDLRLVALPEVIHEQAVSLATLAYGLGLEVLDAAPEIWRAREKQFSRPGFFAVKATMLPTEIAQFTSAVQALGGTSVTQGTGIMTASLPVAASGRLSDLRKALGAARGSLTVLERSADTDTVPWDIEPDTLPLMREIKHRFDPKRTLNPGRFLHGI
jgi:glycolate oxidase FAD binding subunit